MGLRGRALFAVGAMAAVFAMGVSGCASSDQQTDVVTEWNGQQVNAYQAEILSDSEVTLAELASAYDRVAQCIVDHGWQANVVVDQFGAPDVTITGDRGSDVQEMQEVLGACESEWVGPLASIYLADSAPTGAEREAKFVEFEECLRATGATVSGIYLGQEQSEMLQTIVDLNGPLLEWPDERTGCIDTYYLVLWPEMIESAQ